MQYAKKYDFFHILISPYTGIFKINKTPLSRLLLYFGRENIAEKVSEKDMMSTKSNFMLLNNNFIAAVQFTI
jgi:hypothetical protein